MPPEQPSLRDAAAIVGIGHTEFSKDIGRPERTIALEAITAALDDAGLSPSDVDGLVKFTMETTVEVEIARNLGVPNLRWFGEVGTAAAPGAAPSDTPRWPSPLAWPTAWWCGGPATAGAAAGPGR
jgi:hypothetical protein